MRLLAIISMAVFMACVVGCPAGHQTMTKQIMTQTTDPHMISTAVYADALQVYVDAQELYLPYQMEVKASDPELDTQIIGQFRKARRILDRWKLLGTITPDENGRYRDAIRQISLDLAKYMEGK